MLTGTKIVLIFITANIMVEKKFIYLLSTKFSSKTDWQSNGICYNTLDDALFAAREIVMQHKEDKIFFVHTFSYVVSCDFPLITHILDTRYPIRYIPEDDVKIEYISDEDTL